MKNLFEESVLQECLSRINQLESTSTPLWGKMNVAQMMAHCSRALELAMGLMETPKLNPFIKLIGRLIKPNYYNDKPWGKNLATAPYFIMSPTLNFDSEKQKLINLTTQLSKGGPSELTKVPNPFWGKLTDEQQGKGQYKHLDHHLKQFGV